MGLLKKIHKNRKAISPVIATIIIVAVTIAISVAVAGWMMGLWGGLTSVEAMRIYPESTLKADETFIIVIGNTGTGDGRITGVRIGGYDYSNASYPVTLTAGNRTVLTGDMTAAGADYVVGTTYEVHVYTAAGNDYMSTLVCRA